MEDTISGNVVGHAILMEVMELWEEVDCAKSVEELKPSTVSPSTKPLLVSVV